MITGMVSRGHDIGTAYQRACMNVQRGELVSPRGMLTREVIGHQVILDDCDANVLISPVRDLNYRFMVAEWLWIQLGLRDVATIIQYNSQIAQYSDDGVIFNGAYGPRVADQWHYAANCLGDDLDTRQAVIAIWSDNPQRSKDIPCTLTLQFLIRENRLHLVVSMRSSDVWLGLPYDMYNFSQICRYMAFYLLHYRALKLKPGSLVMNLGSSHVYERDWGKVTALIGSEVETLKSPAFTRPGPSWMLSVLKDPNNWFRETFGEANEWSMYANMLVSRKKRKSFEIMREFIEQGGDAMK